VVIGAGFMWTYFPVMCTKRVSLSVCLYVALCMYVCNSETEGAIISKFQCSSRDGSRCNDGELSVEARTKCFPFVTGPSDKAPVLTEWALGTGHRGTDATEVGIGLTGLHAYYTRVWEAGQGCLHNG